MFINRSFKQLWIGRLWSNFGDSLLWLTMSWHIMQATQDTFWIGVLNTVAFLPTMFAFLFGHFIDKYSKRRILIGLEVGRALSTVGILLMFVWNVHNLYALMLLVFLCSLFGMNTYTTQDTLMPQLVDKMYYEKASSLMLLAYKVSDYIFNGLSGYLLSVWTPIYVLGTSVLSFIFSAMSFQRIDVVEESPSPEKEQENPSLFSGFSLIMRHKVVFAIVMGLTLINIGFSGFGVYIVKIASDTHNPITLGLLNAIIALGSLIGSTYIATVLLKRVSLHKKLCMGSLVFGMLLVACSVVTSNIYVFSGLLGVSCVFLGVTQTVINPIIQHHIPEHQLGKVFSAMETISVGVIPLASLAWGVLAHYISNALFFVIFGSIYIVASVIYAYNMPKTLEKNE